jgi:hypothetical protein
MSSKRSGAGSLAGAGTKVRNTAHCARQRQPVTWLARRANVLEEEANDLERQTAAIVQQQQAAKAQPVPPASKSARRRLDRARSIAYSSSGLPAASSSIAVTKSTNQA